MRRTFALSAVLALLVAATWVAFAGASTSGGDDRHNDDRGHGPRVHVLQVERTQGQMSSWISTIQVRVP